MNRTWDERRHHRNRIIKKRRDYYMNTIGNNSWDWGGRYHGTDRFEAGPWIPPRLQMYDKMHPGCSCWMCSDKYDNLTRRARNKRATQKEIDEGLDTYEEMCYYGTEVQDRTES